MATTRPPLFVDVRLRKPKAAQVKPNNESPPGPMGNTVGIVVPDTAPASHAGSAPPIKPTPAEKGWWGSWGSDVAHGALDLAGLIPGVGTITEGINAGIYVAEGDYVNAAISAAGMIPGAGDAAIAGRYAKKGAQAVLKQGEKQAAEAAAKQLEKKAAKEAEEAAAKKAAKEADEAAAKKAEGKGGGKDKGNPRCVLRPYKPDTCKPRTGHHVVPDRVFRTGARGSPHPYGISEAEGLVICVDGNNASRKNDHGKIHALYDPMERAAGMVGKPPGTAKLGVLEVAGAYSAGRVTGCNPILLEAQLRAYHQAKGLGADTIVRADPGGKIPFDYSKIAGSNTAGGGPIE